MFRLINLYILIFFFVACATVPSREEPPLQVVGSVNINKYLGRWYEIARYPNWFQTDCYAVTADYELAEDGSSIKVTNRCKDRQLNGEMREAVGMAHIADSNTSAKLKVTFFWPFYGNYWIVVFIFQMLDLVELIYLSIKHLMENYILIRHLLPLM